MVGVMVITGDRQAGGANSCSSMWTGDGVAGGDGGSGAFIILVIIVRVTLMVMVRWRW